MNLSVLLEYQIALLFIQLQLCVQLVIQAMDTYLTKQLVIFVVTPQQQTILSAKHVQAQLPLLMP